MCVCVCVPWTLAALWRRKLPAFFTLFDANQHKIDNFKFTERETRVVCVVCVGWAPGHMLLLLRQMLWPTRIGVRMSPASLRRCIRLTFVIFSLFVIVGVVGVVEGAKSIILIWRHRRHSMSLAASNAGETNNHPVCCKDLLLINH